MTDRRGRLDRLPPARRRQLRRVVRRPVWGNLRRQQPFSGTFGFDRGTPIDRFYLDRFLESQTDAIRGVVGEVAGSRYVERFGGVRVTEVEVIDIDPTNPAATLIADLGQPGSLPTARFDCLLIVQTLQYTAWPGRALANCVQALRSGGTLLLAVPALAPHDDNEAPEDDRWRFWPAGVASLVREAAPEARAWVADHGNLTAAVAFLHGLAAEELKPGELHHHDSRFPVLVTARVDLPR